MLKSPQLLHSPAVRSFRQMQSQRSLLLKSLWGLHTQPSNPSSNHVNTPGPASSGQTNPLPAPPPRTRWEGPKFSTWDLSQLWPQWSSGSSSSSSLHAPLPAWKTQSLTTIICFETVNLTLLFILRQRKKPRLSQSPRILWNLIRSSSFNSLLFFVSHSSATAETLPLCPLIFTPTNILQPHPSPKVAFTFLFSLKPASPPRTPLLLQPSCYLLPLDLAMREMSSFLSVAASLPKTTQLGLSCH